MIMRRKDVVPWIVTLTWVIVDLSSALPPGSNTLLESFNLTSIRQNFPAGYDVEKYTFPAGPGNSEDAKEVVFRIQGSLKSPKKFGKVPVFIQNGFICDNGDCHSNPALLSIGYGLVDDDYDVWIGTNIGRPVESDRTGNNLRRLAREILSEAFQEELLVLGYENGTLKSFAMTAENLEESPSLIDRIPGVRTIKKWYRKGKQYLKKKVSKAVEKVDDLKDDIEDIINGTSVARLQRNILNAWGFVARSVARTLSIDDVSQTRNHPDVFLDTAQLITKYGYVAETHVVQTEDGYLMKVHRISGGIKSPPRPGKPVVLLQHGILSSSADWVVMGPHNSLSYMLVDEGYDVWLGNSRGNTYSRAHVRLAPSEKAFWNFSWHEMGLYDLPATIDYILEVTGNSRIAFVGHSQGSTSAFVMLSERPEYNQKIVKMAAYAPVAYLGHMKSPVLVFLADVNTYFNYARLLKPQELMPKDGSISDFYKDACESRSVLQIICKNVLFMVFGYDSSQLNKTMLPIIFGHVPAGSSDMQLIHFAQGYVSKKFRPRDDFGKLNPPEYRIENVEIPVGLFYADNDWLVDPRDIEILARKLPNVELMYRIPIEHFNHVDFLFAIDAPEVLYKPTIRFLQNTSEEYKP